MAEIIIYTKEDREREDGRLDGDRGIEGKRDEKKHSLLFLLLTNYWHFQGYYYNYY